MQSNVLGLPVAVWNGAMEIVAKTIEAGGEAVDAIKRGLNYIQKNHRGQWEKKRFNDEVMKELGVRGITVNGQDMFVKDVDREFAPTINGFYSDIEQSVLDVRKGTVTAKEWLDVVGKGDEARYTGVRDWLESLPKNQTVSRKEILDWMEENRIQVVEVVKWEDSLKERVKPIQDELLSVNDKIREYRDRLSELTPEEKTELAILSVKRQELSDKLDAEQSRTIQTGQRYTQYQLPGEKENYKEVLVTLPDTGELKLISEYNVALQNKEAHIREVKYDKNGQIDKNWVSKFRELEAKEKSAKEKLTALGVSVKDGELANAPQKTFKSNHFDEPNILVHLRMNTRTDADGKKTLFLEEIQGDFPQEYRKQRNLVNDYIDNNSAKVIDAFKKKGLLEVICP